MRRLQAPSELALLAVRPLAVDEEPDSILEAEFRPLARSELLLKGLGHRVQLHDMHLVECLLLEHGVSFQP